MTPELSRTPGSGPHTGHAANPTTAARNARRVTERQAALSSDRTELRPAGAITTTTSSPCSHEPEGAPAKRTRRSHRTRGARLRPAQPGEEAPLPACPLLQCPFSPRTAQKRRTRTPHSSPTRRTVSFAASRRSPHRRAPAERPGRHAEPRRWA